MSISIPKRSSAPYKWWWLWALAWRGARPNRVADVLRTDIIAYINAGLKLQYLRYITGRHDLPFYNKKEMEI